jgi:hypothetical protein
MTQSYDAYQECAVMEKCRPFRWRRNEQLCATRMISHMQANRKRGIKKTPRTRWRSSQQVPPIFLHQPLCHGPCRDRMRVATRHGSTYSAHSHRVSGIYFLTPGKWECNTISRWASWDAPQTLPIKNHTTSLRQTLSLPQLSIQFDYSRILLDIIRRDSPPHAQYDAPSQLPT